MSTTGLDESTYLLTADRKQPGQAVIDRLDRLSNIYDRYTEMMERHNLHLLTTLQTTLAYDMQELLTKLAPCEVSTKQIQPQPCKLKHDTVAIKQDMLPTLMHPSTSLRTLSRIVSHAPNLDQNRIIPSLVYPQSPCAIPRLSHQQVPYKIPALVAPSKHLPSRLLPPQTRRTKDNFRPP